MRRGQEPHGIERAGVIGPASLCRRTCVIRKAQRPVFLAQSALSGAGDTHCEDEETESFWGDDESSNLQAWQEISNKLYPISVFYLYRQSHSWEYVEYDL